MPHLQESLADDEGKANALHNMGGARDRMGLVTKLPAYHRQALQDYQESLQLTEKMGRLAVQARTLNNIGEVYIHLSTYEEPTENLARALTFLQQALDIQQTIGHRGRTWMTFSNIGLVYEHQGNTLSST